MEAILVEFEAEADRYAQDTAERQIPGENRTIVCLTPAVRAHLKRNGVPCQSTLNYFDTDSHRQIIMNLEYICRHIRENLVLDDRFLVRQTLMDNILFNVRMFLAHFMVNIEILHRVQDKESVQQWTACLYDDVPPDDVTPQIRPTEHYIGEITHAFAVSRGIPCTPFRLSVNPHRPKSSAARPHFLKRVIGRLYRTFYRRMTCESVGLVTYFGYEMDKVVAELAEKYPDVFWFWLDAESKPGSWLEFKKCLKRMERIFLKRDRGPFAAPLDFYNAAAWQPAGLCRELGETIHQIFQQMMKNSLDMFSYRGVSMGSWLGRKLKADIIPFHLRIYEQSFAIRQLLTDLNPKFVLSQSSDELYGSLGELCADLRIPAVLISHGSNVPADPVEARIEHDHISRRLMNSTYPYVALQSPGAARFADQMRIKSRRILSGPLIWARIDKINRGAVIQTMRQNKSLPNLNGKTRIVLHACSPRSRHSHHFYICQYPDEYIQTITELIKAVEAIEGCFLVVRFRPQIQFSAADLAALLPKSDRYSISTRERFSEVLSIADLLVSFYSATVEEALNNRIPVLLYGGQGRYVQMPSATIRSFDAPRRSAVYHVSDNRYLKFAVENILKNHQHPLEAELLKEHCFDPGHISHFYKSIAEFLNRHPVGSR